MPRIKLTYTTNQDSWDEVLAKINRFRAISESYVFDLLLDGSTYGISINGSFARIDLYGKTNPAITIQNKIEEASDIESVASLKEMLSSLGIRDYSETHITLESIDNVPDALDKLNNIASLDNILLFL
jgi:hypothetical protein